MNRLNQQDHAATAPPGTGRSEKAPTRGTEEEEVSTMLTELIDQIAPSDGDDLIPCRENDAEVWFAELPQDVEFAKALCRTCPVRSQCLAGALDRREPWGVWGGELFIRGEVVARKRPRGRPRKNPVAA